MSDPVFALHRLPGFLPAERTVAMLEHGRLVPFWYLCQRCGQWHVVPEGCPHAA